MPNNHRSYAAARTQLIAYLQTQGYKAHPNEVFCPGGEHCWVDVAAMKGRDYWAFEYKSRNDSIRRGFDQCRSYAKGFNYVVLVADRHRITSSAYFHQLKAEGFGIWRHDRFGFHSLLAPKRRNTMRSVKLVVERQFAHLLDHTGPSSTKLSDWFELEESPIEKVMIGS